MKKREDDRIVSTAVIVAVGVNTLGKREVFGVASGPSEAEPFWKSFLRSLADLAAQFGPLALWVFAWPIVAWSLCYSKGSLSELSL